MSDLTDNQIRGHKANISNPNTSEESKEHSKEVLQSQDEGGDDTVADDKSAMKENDAAATEHENRVLGGHKANLNNPNTSDEAKQYSKEILEEAKQPIE